MPIKYIIHLKHGFCRCFSDSDLATNVRYSLKEGLQIVSVERLPQETVEKAA